VIATLPGRPARSSFRKIASAAERITQEHLVLVLAVHDRAELVGERTADNFWPAIGKEPRLGGLIGDVDKATDFADLLG
jgi:hypothetical protein